MLYTFKISIARDWLWELYQDFLSSTLFTQLTAPTEIYANINGIDYKPKGD